ncbi:hypothetical protein [Streptomyces sp. NPDC052015]|uniref:hypothetical protein n=1 Tax=Streptomyces sp. NPDC052015 TaxID=3154755 RepID=UPI00341BB619
MTVEQPPFKRKRPYMPTVPLLLNGELVEDLERMNAQYPGDLYVTPIVYDSTFALAAFTEREAMLEESRKMSNSAEFRWHVELRGGACADEGTPVPQFLRPWDLPNLRGEFLTISPEGKIRDLSTRVRREFLNWDNAIQSIGICAYPYSAYSDPNFSGIEHFINFRCWINPDWGITISSIRNWGLAPPA